MWFNTAAYKEGDRMATVFETSDSLYGHNPAFIGVKAANFEEEKTTWITLLSNLSQSFDVFSIHRGKMSRRNTIGNDERIDAICPHPVLHILADGTKCRNEAKTSPVDAMQGHQAIEVPQYQYFLAYPEPV